MAASTAASPSVSSHQHQSGKKGDDGSAELAQNSGSQRPLNGHSEAEKAVTHKKVISERPQHPANENEQSVTSNGHGARRSADVSHDGASREGGSCRPNGGVHRKTSNASSESGLPIGPPVSSLKARHASRPDSPVDFSAASPAQRFINGGSTPQSPKRATASMTHGSLKPPAGPSAANRQRHSQAGVSSPEGGLFGLLRRPPPQPYHPATGRSSRGGALPSPASAAGAVLPGVRPRRAGGAAVTAAAAATVASVRPSPGAFIRFVLAPVVLLPVAWPWLLLRSAQALTTAVCLLAAAAVDGLILLAEVLRRNRSGAEFLTTWASGWLAWVVVRYWAGLAQLHAGCEDALGRISQILTPMVAAALSRSPAAARVARLFSPVLAAVGRVQAMVYGAYCFVHDEIVPVALDLAERLPLVHGLLHRAVVGGNE